jgi:DNA-binding transcriptional regulator of glucitol operon
MELPRRLGRPLRVQSAVRGAVQSVPLQSALGEPGPRQPAKVLRTRRWITLHALVWVGAVTMVFLGRWQLQVSDDKHFDLQNFGYALQWWTFTAFALFFWVRAMRDARRPVGQVVGGSRLFVRPTQRTADGSGDGTVSLRGSDPASYVGLADLVTIPDGPGDPALRYRGYLMPNSASTPARSEDDSYHASYNDYLWQLGQPDESNVRDAAKSRPAAGLQRIVEAGPAGNASDVIDHESATDQP